MLRRTTAFIWQHPLYLLLLAALLAVVAELAGLGALWVFIFSALGMVPLAGLLGEATEALAHYTGPRLGGLLNATLGNAAELIITITAIRAGLMDLVKASITGSILGNLLLVLGMSMLFGGIKHGTQTFNRRNASNNAILLMLAVLILLIPSLFSSHIGDPGSTSVETLSLGTAVVMILIYGLGLFYSFKSHGSMVSDLAEEPDMPLPSWSIRTAIFALLAATVGVAYLAELLVGSVEPVVRSLGISEFFIGIIFIPIIGNVAEHIVALEVAMKNRMILSVEIAVSSSLQVALFVAPALVFVSLIIGHPLTLSFNQFELVALAAGVMIAALVSYDGESNWFEGVELLAIYLVLSLAFFFLK